MGEMRGARGKLLSSHCEWLQMLLVEDTGTKLGCHDHLQGPRGK